MKRHRYVRLSALLPLLPLLLAACAGVERRETSVDEIRAQVGDTLVVRTRSAGRWGDSARLVIDARFGESTGNDTTMLGNVIALATGADSRIYATDRQPVVIRVFDRTLRPIALWGRVGSGPGELRAPDGGLVAFADGRVVVRDPGNARAQLFDPSGRSAGEWRVIDAGLRTRDNFARQGDTVLSRIVITADGPIDAWTYGFVRIAPDGVVRDTVAFPTSSLPNARLVARQGNNTAELPLPFAPRSLWAWHPAGGFAVARGDRYAITWPTAAGFIRVERSVVAEPVTNAEAAQERAYVTKGMQWLDPSWTWTGPDVPRMKPVISALFTGSDGTVWALREGAAEQRADPDYAADDPFSVERRLQSRRSFDVFAADGTLLGSLDVPAAMQLLPAPIFHAAAIVALTLDADGVPRLVRLCVDGS